MADTIEFSPDLFYFNVRVFPGISFSYAAALVLVVYDSLLHLVDAVHLYSHSRWIMKVAYTEIQAGILLFMIPRFYAGITPNLIPPVCKALTLTLQMQCCLLFVFTIRGILVLRLCALWYFNRKVTFILFSGLVVEIMCDIAATVTEALKHFRYAVGPLPISGCYTSSPPAFSEPAMVVFTVARIFGFVNLSLEMLMTLIGLYQHLRSMRRVHKTLRSRVSHMQHDKDKRLFWVLYRDGTLFFIPIFAFEALLFFAQLHPESKLQQYIDWPMWNMVVQFLCGTRLILNLKNSSLTDTTPIPSIASRIAFAPGSVSDSESA